MSPIHNRLQKNWEKLSAQAARLGLEAFRFYDRDIPEYPYVAEIFGTVVIIQDRRQEIDFSPARSQHHADFLSSVRAVTKAKEVLVKTRRPQRLKGDKSAQYKKLAHRGERFVIREGDLKFWINPYDYQDCGLYLDHRRLREKVGKSLRAGQSFLNLFAYTGSFSVYAAAAGARVTSVDLSTTYTLWAEDNFKLNGLKLEGHEFIGGDVRGYLRSAGKRQWDMIVLDPPTFSNSKRTEQDFDVQRDHPELIELCLRCLKPGGQLYFSCNKRDFKFTAELSPKFKVQDLTKESLPFDFKDIKTRRVYLIN